MFCCPLTCPQAASGCVESRRRRHWPAFVADSPQDSRSQRLYFVDIDLNTVYVYDPKQGKYGYSHFDKNVTAIALLAGQEGVSVQLATGVEPCAVY